MNERAIRVLEFQKIRDMLAEHAVTETGRALCLSLEPEDTLTQAEQAQEETAEAVYVLGARGDSPILYSDDVRPHLSRALKGAVLPPRALLDIASSLSAARAARAALSGEGDNTRHLRALAGRLQPIRTLEEDIRGAILGDEQIADQASSELASIRRQIRLMNDRVKDRLNAFIHQPSYSKYLQEPIITVRNGRYVVPVRQEYRQNIPGLVHDQSSSGATIFIEPMALVELGNELKQWTAKENQEIERILSAFSSLAASSADVISQNVSILGHLDFVFAKARLAQEMDGVRPKLNDKRYLKLIQVRHPLLPRDTAVPCDLYLGDRFTTLIITGPNTGGKTVALKTVGLMTLMAQAGLQVPGLIGTELSVFREVYADIGDEQSIEQSLSTFSSHMTNIVSILDSIESDCLALFDELGAGTDPTEGAALAQAILARLKRMDVRTMATTHYSELKAYALTTPGVENASAEFDVATLRPTYRLSIGIPGKSNAFEISRRLGLSSSLIDDAQKLLSAESVKFEDVIANAEYHRQLAIKEQQLAHDAYLEADQARATAQKIRREMDRKFENADKKAREEARRIIEKAKRETSDIIAELRMMKTRGGAADSALSDITRRMRGAENAVYEHASAPDAEDGLSPRQVRVGDSVRLLNLNTPATVLSLPDAKGELQIQAGAVKMTVRLNQLSVSQEKPAPRKTTVSAKTAGGSRVGFECDVRGLSLDEALMEVDNYLSSAVMSGFNEVSIIHGKGTGTLRAGIQQHLKRHSMVKSSRLGVYGEGETGVTIVTLK